jgi:hypothetical protein
MNTFLKIAAAGLAAVALTACVEESSTRSGAGMQAPVNYDDLRVGGEMDAERGLESRGFVTVDGSQSDMGYSHLIMYNRQTGQCVDLETKGGQVMTMNEVTNPKCR